MSSKTPLIVGSCLMVFGAAIYKWTQKQQRTQEDGFIYMDYNGTTPIYPSVLEAMMPYLTEHFGNPSSSHLLGKY